MVKDANEFRTNTIGGRRPRMEAAFPPQSRALLDSSVLAAWARPWRQTSLPRDIGSLHMSVARIRWTSSLRSDSSRQRKWPAVRLRGRHQHAAGRHRRSRPRAWTRRLGDRRSRLGIEARRNSSFHEHNKHGTASDLAREHALTGKAMSQRRSLEIRMLPRRASSSLSPPAPQPMSNAVSRYSTVSDKKHL